MAELLKTNVTPAGFKVMLLGVIAFLIVDVLDKWGYLNLSSYISPVLIPMITSLFVLFEIGFIQLLKRQKKLDAIDSISLTFAILGLVSAILAIFNMVPSSLESVQGAISLGLAIFVLIQIFKK